MNLVFALPALIAVLATGIWLAAILDDICYFWVAGHGKVSWVSPLRIAATHLTLRTE